VARKNGKSTLAAAVGLYALVADREARAEVYSCATKRDQALIVWNEAKRMVKSSAEVRRFVKALAHSLTVPDTFGKFEALGADSDTMDGLNVHAAIVDELHAHKKRDLWDVLLTATGARRQPLIFAITTAGFDMSEASICWLQHEYAEKVLAGEIKDDAFFAFIASLDPEDNWEEESNWIKANPNLMVSLKIEDIREEAERVKKSPTSLNPFLRYKMNVWTSSEKGWITADQWKQSSKTQEIDLERLAGRPCYLGMDLAKKVDTSAIVAVFPPEEEGGEFIAIPHIFLPGETLAHRERNERIPWIDWKARGLIYTSPGKVIENEDILNVIRELDQRYQVKDCLYDRWRAPEILPALESMGWCADPKETHAERYLIEFGQGFKDMSPALRFLEELIFAGRLNHGNHPILAWQISCVAILDDEAGNAKFSKKRSKGKIDAAVALAMAAYRARLHEVQTVSVYEERGITVIGLD
jgi:phage terminase large subunit-like protein